MGSKIKKFLFILGKEYKKNLLVLLILMIFGSFLELLGISLLIPFAGIVSGEKIINLTFFPKFIENLIVSTNQADLFIFGLSFFVGLYFFKSCYLIFLYFYQNKLVFNLQSRLSSLLFEKYLNQSYLFHVNKNSSLVLRNIINETHLFTEGVLLQGMIFFSECVVFLMLFSLLIIINPVSTISVLVLLIIILGTFTAIIRKKVKILGSSRQFSEANKIKEINHALGSIKEMILYAKKSFFLNKMSDWSLKAAKSTQIQNSILSIPRLSMEFISVFAILLIVLVMFKYNHSFFTVIQVVIIFGIAAFRLIPAANRIANFFQYIFYHHIVIDLLYEELKLKDQNDSEEEIRSNLVFSKNIFVNNIEFNYPGDKMNVLEDVTFVINKSQSIGIVGESGSGKSTLINIILGLLKQSKGSILLDDININQNLSEWRSKIGYVPQDIYLLDDTIANNIAYGANQIDINLINLCINSVFLQNFILALPKGIDTVVGERGLKISGGQKQRIGIARALYRNPEILVFDESTNSLDPKTEMDLMNDIFLIKQQKTIIFITHKITLLSRFDKVFEIKNKRILEKNII